MPEVVIQKSSNPKKKYDAVIDGKKKVLRVIVTSQNTKMKIERKNI